MEKPLNAFGSVETFVFHISLCRECFWISRCNQIKSSLPLQRCLWTCCASCLCSRLCSVKTIRAPAHLSRASASASRRSVCDSIVTSGVCCLHRRLDGRRVGMNDQMMERIYRERVSSEAAINKNLLIKRAHGADTFFLVHFHRQATTHFARWREWKQNEISNLDFYVARIFFWSNSFLIWRESGWREFTQRA